MSAILLCLMLTVVGVSAQDTSYTDTFTHWSVSGGQRLVALKPLYGVKSVLTPRSLGVTEDIGVFTDMDRDQDGTIYIMTDASRILRLDTKYRLLGEYTVREFNGAAVDFSGAEGILAVAPGEVYIADTKNARVLHCLDGLVTHTYLLPQSDLIPEGFTFQPVGVARDSRNYLYIVSKGSYYGALLFDPQGGFAGFYGANTVGSSVLTVFGNLWDALTQNDEKRAKTKKSLPYDFSDLCVDQDDFVYTCTGMNANGNLGQIRILSPGGTNILSGSESRNFGESDVAKRLNAPIRQNFCSIATDGDFIFALDKGYGLLYLYDVNGTELCVFGGGRGIGAQEGVFSSACALALAGTDLLVADSLNNTVTVFSVTEYGKLVLSAQQRMLRADYAGAQPLWEQVKAVDSFNRLATIGLGKAALERDDCREAMRYAKEAGDTETYSRALSKIQTAFISQHFLWLFLLALLIIGGVVALLIVSLKRKLVLIKNARLRTMLSCSIHPFSSFYDIKYRGQGSLALAIAAAVLFYLTSVISVIFSDFRYTSFDATTYNALFSVVETVGVIVLWSVANWAISTLQQGKGRLKEVFVVTMYATVPLTVYHLISTPLTHMLASSDSTLLSGLNILAMILTGVILCVGMMVIHDFSFPRFLFTAFLTVLLMLLIVFVLFMIGILLSQFFSFIVTIVTEASQW